MITTEKVLNVDMEMVRKYLLSKGYISANYLYRCDPDKLREEFGIEINYLPTPRDLREMCDDLNAPVDSICLVFENGKKSYWYKVSDLIETFMMPYKEQDNVVRNKGVELLVTIGVIIAAGALGFLIWSILN
jgi:hypothetical protein